MQKVRQEFAQASKHDDASPRYGLYDDGLDSVWVPRECEVLTMPAEGSETRLLPHLSIILILVAKAAEQNQLQLSTGTLATETFGACLGY